MKKLFLEICAVMLLIFGAILLCTFKEPLSVVYWSTSKDECIKVVKNDIDCNCNNIPKIYHKVWVK